MNELNALISNFFENHNLSFELHHENNYFKYIFEIKLAKEKILGGLICSDKPDIKGRVSYIIRINLHYQSSNNTFLNDTINKFNYKSPYFKAYIDLNNQLFIETHQLLDYLTLPYNLNTILNSLINYQYSLQAFCDDLQK